MNNQAKFITLEGVEGAGKTTAIQTIVKVLEKYGIYNPTFTREPGGTALAEKLRELIKYSIDNEPVTDKAELLMLYAARIQLVENVIKPALEKGQWVIGDRHDMSTQAYQGGGRQFDVSLLATLKEAILGSFTPDLIIYLDIDPIIGLERARSRGELDRIEQQYISFFTRTRQRYLELVKDNPNAIIIDASQNIDNVACEIEMKLTQWLENDCNMSLLV